MHRQTRGFRRVDLLEVSTRNQGTVTAILKAVDKDVSRAAASLRTVWITRKIHRSIATGSVASRVSRPSRGLSPVSYQGSFARIADDATLSARRGRRAFPYLYIFCDRTRKTMPPRRTPVMQTRLYLLPLAFVTKYYVKTTLDECRGLILAYHYVPPRR